MNDSNIAGKSRAILYLAGGLFTAGEQLHNLMLEKYLKLKGYTVILPQREGNELAKIFDGAEFTVRIARACARHAGAENVVVVANLDGADSDSGTAVEYGIAWATKKKAITYRTDFRTAVDREMGRNAMFSLEGTAFLYLPVSKAFENFAEVEHYYAFLAEGIDSAVKEMTNEC